MRGTALGIVAFVLLSSLVTAGAGAAGPGGSLPQTAVDADTVSLRAELASDGSATWRVTYRIELEGENETAAFAELRSDIESNPAAYVERFADRMRRTAAAAENTTGRDMSVENVSVAARREALPQGTYGLVVYRLTWRGFGSTEGDTLRAGDAIDQFFIDDKTSLTLAWPDQYEMVSVVPTPTSRDNASLTWQGRRDFGPDQPRIVLETAPTSPADKGLPLTWLVAGGVVVLVVGGWVLLHLAGDRGPVSGPSPDDEGESSPPAELLSNEERVLQLLDEHGGRMKQQEVAELLEWTDAKTSQVVGELRESDELESFRLGRENVLTLPNVSVTGEEVDEDAE